MGFNEFKKSMQDHITGMLKDTDHLFVVDLDKDALYNLYLDSFPAGMNSIYRKNREFDCSSCRHFIKSFGNVVVIKNNMMTTIWDFECEDPVYQPVIRELSAFVHSFKVSDVFITKEANFGIDKSREVNEDKTIHTWEHLFYKLPKSFVDTSFASVGEKMGEFRDIRNVFKRSLEEISIESVEVVLELIAQKSLYKGEEWEATLKKFLTLMKNYQKLSALEKDNFCWEQSLKVGPVIGKIKNHSIGTLLTDITVGVELDEAVRKFEALVAPANYKRPQAIFTKKMLEDAQAKIEELGFKDSLGRRFATLDDISVPNILFANRDAVKRMTKGDDIFDELANKVAVNPKNFDRVEEVSIETFINDILPTVQSVEVLLENRHAPNMVSVVAPKVAGSKSMFKWGNPFSWAYAGNITDSMKERVKTAGGKVDGVLRFSIQWNDGIHNPNDFDAHCIEPKGNEIYFANYHNTKTNGRLDVDIRNPIAGTPAVENITWPSLAPMEEGTYTFAVHNWSHRGGREGFSAEIEFDGQIFSFNYDRELKNKETIKVAKVSYSRREGFKIIELLPFSTSSRDVWGLSTNQFYPVSVLMFSPNYWDKQDGIGNKHYFFMLKGCVNTEQPNGFFNEFLTEDLMKYRKVLEAVGGKMHVEDVKDQLSGIGFSSTIKNSLVCKVEGHVNRTLKINF